MRKPSRRVPQDQAQQSSWLGAILAPGFAVGIVVLLLAALVEIWRPLAILVPAVIVGWGLISWLRDKRIAEERKGESICQFARAFDRRSTDTWIIRAVYEEFSPWSFPPRPSDRLREDLHICDDDRDFGAISIAQRSGRSLEGCERNPLFGKVETLRDMVMFFQHQPLLNASQHVRQQR